MHNDYDEGSLPHSARSFGYFWPQLSRCISQILACFADCTTRLSQIGTARNFHAKICDRFRKYTRTTDFLLHFSSCCRLRARKVTCCGISALPATGKTLSLKTLLRMFSDPKKYESLTTVLLLTEAVLGAIGSGTLIVAMEARLDDGVNLKLIRDERDERDMVAESNKPRVLYPGTSNEPNTPTVETNSWCWYGPDLRSIHLARNPHEISQAACTSPDQRHGSIVVWSPRKPTSIRRAGPNARG